MIGELWGLSPYLAILLGAALPTHVWRWLGVFAAGRLDEASTLFAFVRAVATALVAAVIAKLVLTETGALAEVPVAVRIAAAAAAFAAYLAARQSLLVGVLVGETLLIGAFLIL